MKSWLVNTNSKSNNNNPNGFKYMLRQNKVAAFYDQRNTIDNINKGDLVLLYHNNNRIIAVGFALDNLIHDFEDIDKVEHWVDVNWIWKSNFDKNNEPTNFINRNDVGITMVNGAVINITAKLNIETLIKTIALNQKF